MCGLAIHAATRVAWARSCVRSTVHCTWTVRGLYVRTCTYVHTFPHVRTRCLRARPVLAVLAVLAVLPVLPVLPVLAGLPGLPPGLPVLHPSFFCGWWLI